MNQKPTVAAAVTAGRCSVHRPVRAIFLRMGKPVLKDKYHPEARLWDDHGQHSKKRKPNDNK